MMPIEPNVTDESDRSLLNRRVWLAPICLCLVAGLHLYRVSTAGQTPWKGGGFGMFSTYDAENARFVRAWLVTTEGRRPIEIPSELDKRVAELRAAPQQVGLDELTARLAQRGWYDPAAAREQLAQQLQNRSADQPISGDELQVFRNASIIPKAATPSENIVSLVAAKKGDRAGQIVPFLAVEAELYKFEIPAGTTQLRARKLFTSVHKRDRLEAYPTNQEAQP